MNTTAEKIIFFCRELEYSGKLPEGITVMNPFRNDSDAMSAVIAFYRKFYNDYSKRHLILGINPGRYGAGVTGIPFTDTIRLKEKCGLSISGLKTYETSSVFIYEMIESYGGPEKFYGDFYISSISPLGFTSKSPNGREVNFNYYDSRELTEAIHEFIISSIKKQLEFGIKRDVCFCLGTGKNYKFLKVLNEENGFFGKIEPLEHPRFIMQYKLKSKDSYIRYYNNKLSEAAKNYPVISN